ncbi:KAT8 regulatory NSL complex subunit 3 [Vanessa atalanta]|uniref:KAT8 regulatory NSL complex subunit 3 n=1 Tax=Vanessa atalanta TaxID=42275 RepID=UPI001FCDA3AF|nr:KAT8 regulatory NSL complex subunit 3 [Vanessa atalanta]
MVMATDVLYAEQQVRHEEPEVDGELGEATALHEQLVRHVLAVSGELESRSDVWGEHSYARAHGHATNSQVRALLPEPDPDLEPDDVIDVQTEQRRPPAPPLDECDDELDDEVGDDDDADDDWEERLVALAPSAAHVRLANVALSALRDLRLERLAGPRGRWARREGARAAARRLRGALAAHWAGGAGWLHAALGACLPRSLGALYAELATELRRALPRLADRLPMPRPASPYVDPLSAVNERRSASEPGPWLAWAPGGCEAEDERWVRRLGAALHTRRLRTAPDAGPAPPDRWCAAVAHDARSALGDLLTEAGRRAVILGGAGAGASLAAWLAAGAGAAARVRGLLLLAPPLLTAEGPRDCPDDVLEEVEVPLLAVVGGGAAQCWRGAAAEVASRFGAAERGARAARRVLLLAGADDALRLPRSHRRRLRLPQQALDAAVAEECARWAAEAAEGPAGAPGGAAALAGGVAGARRRGAEGEAARATPGASRSVDVIEGRVVSRVSGGSPLALLPPRRVESRAEPRAEPLAVADIMQLPIVFADDDPAAARTLADAALAPDASPLTVTSGAPGETRDERSRRRRGAGGGALRYTRVIVAKRGAARPAARAARPPARPVLLRRRAPPAPAAPPADCTEIDY